MPAVPDPHDEKYRVTTEPSGNPLSFSVSKIDTQHDDPVETFYLYRNNSKPNRSGIENPEDTVAKVYLNTNTFGDADDEITIGSIVSYTSKRILGVENIFNFSWS
jgi:hypothetical protein